MPACTVGIDYVFRQALFKINNDTVSNWFIVISFKLTGNAQNRWVEEVTHTPATLCTLDYGVANYLKPPF